MNPIPSKEAIEDFLNFIAKCKTDPSFKSYISIKNALNVFSIPYPVVSLVSGKILYRSRVHLNNEDFFTTISDLSHRLDVNNIVDFGRANEPLQSIFYCSDDQNTARIETSQIAKKKIDKEKEVVTTGIWQVSKELRVGHIISNVTIEGLNKTVDGLQTSFVDLVEKFRSQDTQTSLNVLNLFSEEFTRDAEDDSRNYLISCAFANYVFDHFGYDTHLQKGIKPSGVLYPSVVYRNQGMNLALKSEVIESENLKLIGAVRSTLKRIGELEYKDDEVVIAKNINSKTFEIDW